MVNMQMTIRFLLRNTFCHSDIELTQQMGNLHCACPTLFDNILPRSDKSNMVAEEELGFEMDISGGADSSHRRTTVIGRVSINGTSHLINENHDLPTKSKHMSPRFKEALRRAYFNEYDTGDVYRLGNKSLQWANKLAFTDG
jgi:hypothetical protein